MHACRKLTSPAPQQTHEPASEFGKRMALLGTAEAQLMAPAAAESNVLGWQINLANSVEHPLRVHPQPLVHPVGCTAEPTKEICCRRKTGFISFEHSHPKPRNFITGSTAHSPWITLR